MELQNKKGRKYPKQSKVYFKSIERKRLYGFHARLMGLSDSGFGNYLFNEYLKNSKG